MFTVINAVMLRPLRFPHAEQIVAVWSRNIRNPGAHVWLSYPDFNDLRSTNRVFSALGAYDTGAYTVTGLGGPAAHVQGAQVSADLFPLLQVNPVIGRWFLPTEDVPGSRVVILSYALWQRRFGGDKSICGKAITLDGQEYQVVGVMPQAFRFPLQNDPVELWTSAASLLEPASGAGQPSATARDFRFLHVLGRLRPGTTLAQAEQNISAIAAALAKQYPDSNSNYTSATILPLLADLTGEIRLELIILFGAAACLLLIACVNIANLLLARASAREKEFSVRAALGASRGRIIRQLITESTLLSLVGGVAGLILAFWGTTAIAALLPEDFPRATDIDPDVRVLLFTFFVSLLAGLAFGLAPLRRLSRPDLAVTLHETAGRGSTASAGGRRARATLVSSEIVLTFALLTGAGLLLRTFWQLQSVQLGFDPHNVLAVNLSLPDSKDSQAPVRTAQFCQLFLQRAREIPGIRSIGAIAPLPLSGQNWTSGFDISGRPTAKKDRPVANIRIASPGYFRTMGIPLLEGRDFDERDTRDSAPVVIY